MTIVLLAAASLAALALIDFRAGEAVARPVRARSRTNRNTTHD